MSDRNQLVSLIMLGLLGLAAVVGAICLAVGGREVPQPLIALAGVSAGALATFAALANHHGNPPPNP